DGTTRDVGDLIRFDAWAVFSSLTRAGREPRMWCAKEVGGDTGRIVGLWRQCFPQGRVLLIVRDPMMIARAILNDRRRKGRRPAWPEIVSEVLDAARVVAAEAQMLGDPDVLMVAYEDLVADTAVVMARVAAFLGVNPAPVLSRPTLFGEPVVVRTASRETTEVFRPAASWREGLSVREQRIVAAAATACRLLPRYRVDYESLRRRIAGGRPARPSGPSAGRR